MTEATLESPHLALERLRQALKSKDWAQVEALSGSEAPALEVIDHPLLQHAGAAQSESFLQTIADVYRRATHAERADLWEKLESEPIAVHPRGPREAEVIERVTAGAQRILLSTTMDASSGAWRAIATRHVLEDRVLLWMPRIEKPENHGLSAEAFERSMKDNWDEPATLALHADGTLAVTTSEGVVQGTIGPPMAALRARFPKFARHGSQLSLRMELPEDIDARLERLGVLATVVWSIFRLGADGVVLPEHDMFMEVWTFCDQVKPAIQSVSGLSRLWVTIGQREDRLCTSGMRYFRLPELETPVGARPRQTEKFLRDTIEYLLHHDGPDLEVGHTLGPADAPTHRALAGAIGPAPGLSYGRAGSLFLEPIARGSRKRR